LRVYVRFMDDSEDGDEMCWKWEKDGENIL
jgi:hypothetical protein